MTPFDTPVVPPLYWYMAMSSKVSFCGGGGRAILGQAVLPAVDVRRGLYVGAIFFFLATSGKRRFFGKGR